MSQINSFRDLIVFQKSYDLAMEILQLQKVIPKRKNIHLLIKLEDRPDQYQQIYQKLGQKGFILNHL